MMARVENRADTPPPCRVLSKSAAGYACKKKDRGERVTNENVHGCRFQAGQGPDGLGRRPGRTRADWRGGFCGGCRDGQKKEKA